MFAKNLLVSALIATGAIGAVAIPAAAGAASIYIQTAPPAPRVEVAPAPRRGYVWSQGYWNWNGHRHVWVKGSWARERRGYAYRPNTWVEENGRWRLNRGGWDRDGDGIPNNRDAHPDNPRRP
jgi:WXXGXW repeat (2 copies)